MIIAAKRARQINAYYSQLGEGLLEYVGPLVETAPQEKPLSIALREINTDLIEFKPLRAGPDAQLSADPCDMSRASSSASPAASPRTRPPTCCAS